MYAPAFFSTDTTDPSVMESPIDGTSTFPSASRGSAGWKHRVDEGVEEH